MTISSANRKAGPYVGNGSATSFAFTFKVFVAADVVVTKTTLATGVEAVLALTTDYTVSLNADQNANPGGSVTYAPSPTMAATHSLTLTSAVAQTQGTDIPSAGGWYPEVVENALDKATILTQQQQEVLDRTIRLPVAETGAVQLPAAVVRASKIIGFDANGDVTVYPAASAVYGVLRDYQVASAGQTVFNLGFAYSLGIFNLKVFVNGLLQRITADYAESGVSQVTFTYGLQANDEVEFFAGQDTVGAVGDASSVSYTPSGSGAQVTNVRDKLRETVSVKDFGAVGDGVTDDTAAIQAAINSLASANVYPHLEFEGGKRYKVTDSGTYALLFDRPMVVNGNGAIIVYNGSQIGVRVNSNNVILHDLHVLKSNYSTAGATSALTGTGWSIYADATRSAQDCKFYNCTAEGYSYGFSFIGNGTGVSYIEAYGCDAINNHINVHFNTADVANSYTTHIRWHGGRAMVLSVFGGGYVGSRGISIAKSYAYAVDGIVFHHTTVEGYAERKVYLDAPWCALHDLYYDAQGPTAIDVEITAQALYGLIVGGAGLDLQVISRHASSNVLVVDPKQYTQLTARTFAAGSYSGAGSMTWDVESGDVSTERYQIVDGVMTVWFYLVGTVVGGTPNTNLRIEIPASKVAAYNVREFCAISDAGTPVMGFCEVGAGDVYIKIYKPDVTNFSAGTTAVEGRISFPIQS